MHWIHESRCVRWGGRNPAVSWAAAAAGGCGEGAGLALISSSTRSWVGRHAAAMGDVEQTYQQYIWQIEKKTYLGNDIVPLPSSLPSPLRPHCCRIGWPSAMSQHICAGGSWAWSVGRAVDDGVACTGP
jgi:hypothetical protein